MTRIKSLKKIRSTDRLLQEALLLTCCLLLVDNRLPAVISKWLEVENDTTQLYPEDGR
jgi:hypothetical protein